MTVVDQAENVGGVVSAARMREGFMRRRANARNEEEREALSDAIGTIEVRFPELEDLPAGGAERFARDRGHGKKSRSPSHEGRQRQRSARKPDAAPLEEAARGAGTPQRSKTAPAPAKPQRGQQGKSGVRGAGGAGRNSSSAGARRRGGGARGGIEGRARRRIGQAYRETGIPDASSSTSQILMSVVGATVGLAALYLVLTSAERPGTGGYALPQLLGAIGGFFRRIIAPEDFFGPGLTRMQFAAIENPGGVADQVEGSLRAGNRAVAGAGVQLKPGHVTRKPILPKQLGFKK